MLYKHVMYLLSLDRAPEAASVSVQVSFQDTVSQPEVMDTLQQELDT